MQRDKKINNFPLSMISPGRSIFGQILDSRHMVERGISMYVSTRVSNAHIIFSAFLNAQLGRALGNVIFCQVEAAVTNLM